LGRFDERQVRQLFAEMEQRSAGGRTAGSATYRSVADWIRDLLLAQAPALAVRFDDHGEYRNVEITIPGRDPDAGVFLLGAHLDTFPRTPGMDDNASGALGAALIAAALAHYRFAAEIRVVLFDAEEIGLIGSALYARALRDGGCQPNDCLRRYVNMDMIGHDPKDEALVWALTASPALPAEVASIARTHGIELEVRGGGDGCNESDDCSFSRLGYPTVYFNEAIPFSDLHTPRDTNAVIHFGTMVKILRLVAATLATWAGLEGPAP